MRQWVATADAEADEIAGMRREARGAPDDCRPDEENPRYRQLLQILLPIESSLLDVRQSEEVLCGHRALSSTERLRWQAILKLTLESVMMRDYGLDDAVAEFSAAQRAVILSLAENLVRLAVVHRCARELEEAIEKRIRRLRQC